MFYLKYRPQTIEEIDTELVRKKLQTILASQKIPHAILLTGPKGTGKTSTARIIAKSINCLKNLYSGNSKNPEPCNSCQNCKSITSGSAVDIVEIDAASNRKIDDIRSLIEQIKFAPLAARYKVYIVDEVHMLTTEAFNAILKTLEEPPPFTIFILATTEVDKLPKTIISRCIRFIFNKAQQTEIVRMLDRIVKSESLKIDKNGLNLIASRSDYSFRDAAKILEELSIEKATDLSKIEKHLGVRSENRLILESISKKDLKKTLSQIQQFDRMGGDFKLLIEFILNELHLALISKSAIEEASDSYYNFSMTEITKLVKLLYEAYNMMKVSPNDALPLEIVVAQYIGGE